MSGVNLAFIAADLAVYGANLPLVSGRLLVSAALLGATWLLRGPAPGPVLSRWLAAAGALIGLGMGLCALGSGGQQSPYFAFSPFLPVVIGMMVPDEPAMPIAAGLASWAVAVGLLSPPDPTVLQQALLVLGYGSCTFYGWIGALLYRRMRRRERATWRERERALDDLREAESRRAQAERLAALGRLTAGVAHEINNPLAFVATNLGFVREELTARGEADPEVLLAIEESQEGLERMKRIVQDMRGFARGPGEPAAPVALGAAVDEALRTASARLAPLATVLRELPEGLPRVKAGQAGLVQVLVNLLVNAGDAIDALPARRGAGTVRVRATVEGDEVALDVEDSGAGLGAEARARLFEPFFTTKGPRGTGLGLALSRELVERWGGRLSAHDGAGGGACFTVRLPRA